jgi:hypothetical protein
VEAVNVVDSYRCNVNTFSRKLPATVKPDIYCYVRTSFSARALFRSCSPVFAREMNISIINTKYLINIRENRNENIS